jgi:L-galactose dehydrogenase
MRYRPLGSTGLNVSVLGYGASPLGSVFRNIDEAEGIRTVHTALDLGVNLIDVSPYYGVTRAETVLGKALATVPRERYLLATKVGRYERDGFDFSAARVTASVDESLRRLGVEYLDLIQCHDIEFGSLDQIIEETLPALEHVRQQGKARFVGITGYPLAIFDTVATRASLDTILSYCHYCLNDTTLAALLPRMAEREIGVINASPLAMGLLTERGAPEWHPAPTELKDACRRAAEHCRSRGARLADLALRFALAEPGIATTLVGTASPQNLRQNVAAVGQEPDLELLTQVQAILAPVRDLSWPSGRPENSR